MITKLQLLALLALLARATLAHAQPADSARVSIEVIDVAGGRAYVSPGEAAGLHAGDEVHIRKQVFKLRAVSQNSAMFELHGEKLKRGARGEARVSTRAESSAVQRKRPRELAQFVGQWPNAKPPALEQHPKPVPLGPLADTGTTRAGLSLAAAGSVPLREAGSPWLRAELRARVHTEPFRDLPLRLDGDAALQLWAAGGQNFRASDASRPLLRVRALELAYGHDSGLFAAAGRLRYAARTLGTLDGLKAQTPLWGGLTLAAFGGFVPDPLSGKPSTDAARFGGELAWEDLSHALRPHVALTAQASRFDGGFDERRLNAAVDVFPGRSHAGAYASFSLFDRDNPWNASPRELSAAGASTETRFGEFELGARVDMQRPERSRWLASFLPPGWFCARVPGANGQDTCRAGDARYLGELDVAWRRPNLALTLGATGSRSVHADSEQLGAFASASLLHLLDTLHLDGSLMGQTGSLVRSAAISVGAGALLASERLDLSLHYRPALSRYSADTGTFLEHSWGANVLLLLGSDLDLTLAADAIAGRDVSVLLFQTLLNWRPPSV